MILKSIEATYGAAPKTCQANRLSSSNFLSLAWFSHSLPLPSLTPCRQVRFYRGLLDFTRDTAGHLGFGAARRDGTP
jgi:hypothetical protein